MGDESATVAILNTALFEKLQHGVHRFLRRSSSRKMRCIGREFARHVLKPFHVLRIIGTYELSEGIITNRSFPKSSLTWHSWSCCIHNARADSHEQDSLAFVKRTVTGDGKIDSRFANGVRSRNSEIDLVDEIGIRYASRQREDFLLPAFTKERDEGVDGVDHADDVNLETILEVLVQGLGSLGAAMR